MPSQTQINNSLITPAVAPRHHWWRTFFASILGTLALLLIFFSIFTVWLNRTLTDTNTYVSTVSPLVSKPAIQNFVIQKVTDEILQNVPTKDVATTLLPGQGVDQANVTLQAMIKPIIQQGVQQVVTSQGFANIWKTANTTAHSQLIAQLKQPDSDQLTFNLNPVITGVIDELKQTKLNAISDKITINPDAGKLTVQNPNIVKIHKFYNQFNRDTIINVIAAVVLFSLAIVISVHHAKTLRRILIGTGIGTLLLALLIHLVSYIHLSNVDDVQQKAIIAIIEVLLHNLQVACIIIGIGCFVVAIGYKIIEKMRTRPVQYVTRAAPPPTPPKPKAPSAKTKSTSTKV